MTKWLKTSANYLGQREVKGPHNNPEIMKLLDVADGKKDGKTLQGIANDEVPWCASYVSGVLEESGVRSARTAWARGYLNWGVKLDGPAVGAIVVFERGPKSGHVGFIVGKNQDGHLVVQGGNQSDMVRNSPFSLGRVLGYRWPEDEPLPARTGIQTVALVRTGGRLSQNEA